MLLLFQLLITVFAVSSMIAVLKRKKQGVLGTKGAAFWLIFWIAGLIIIWWPEMATQLAQLFGIGRGTDFIIYIAIALIFLLLFRLHIKIESVGRDVTAIIRKDALKK